MCKSRRFPAHFARFSRGWRADLRADGPVTHMGGLLAIAEAIESALRRIAGWTGWLMIVLMVVICFAVDSSLAQLPFDLLFQ